MRSSCIWKIGGPKTFRLASAKILGKWGGNLQNIEKGMREIYIPDPGKIFGQVDQAGAEALIVAFLGRPGKFRELFAYKIKPHIYVALRLFKDVWSKKMREHNIITSSDHFDIDEIIETPIAQLKQHPLWESLKNLIADSDNWSLQERYYYLAKQTCHSGNYGITPPTFRMNVLEKSGGKIVIKKEESERFILTYQSLFPEIFEWHEIVRKQVETTGMLYNLHGHPYTVTQPVIAEHQWKELYAWIPQSTVGEITNIAVTKTQQYIEESGLDWDVLVNGHDSILSQCPIPEINVCLGKMTEYIQQTFTSPYDGAQFTMGSEAQAGYNWAPAKKDKNPDGLRTVKL